MELSFYTLDVFTSKRLQGNPLAVVKVPAALKDQITQEKKLKITAEFNLSETVFLHEPQDEKASELTIDIFTIGRELPFAGHPTIGSAVLAKYHLYPSVDTLVTKAGPIGLVTGSKDRARLIRAKIPHNVHLHSKTLRDVIPPAQHETYPGLSHFNPQIRAAELDAPVFSIVKGMTFVLVKLPTLDLLSQVRKQDLNFDNLPEPLLDPDFAPSYVARYYFVEDDPVSGPGEPDAVYFRTRMIEESFEDPATGSAASTLAAYLTVKEGMGMGVKFVLVQGVEMGRRSEIHVETTVRDVEIGEEKVQLGEVWLGGEAVVVQKGVISVE